MNSDNFFLDLPETNNFFDLINLACYQELPQDWIVAIADAEGSTEAIKKNKYKAINSLGVAVITACINATKPIKIPYVFGGDGASLCVPKRFESEIKDGLMAVKRLAKESYDLNLRIGVVPARDIKKAGYQTLVSKYRISKYCTQASFNGGGLRFAEDCVKDKSRGYQLEDAELEANADFSGFECRWQDFPSPYGETVALLIKATAENKSEEVYKDVLKRIKDVYGDFKVCHPLSENKMRLSFNPRRLRIELDVRTFRQSMSVRMAYWFNLFLAGVIGLFCMRVRIKFGHVEWGKYKSQTILNSDVKKFDDMLRLVVSGNSTQREELESWLKEKLLKNELAYGLHVSSSALMTCFVVDYGNEHYHFIDGADGGYALAAVDLKRRLKEPA